MEKLDNHLKIIFMGDPVDLIVLRMANSKSKGNALAQTYL
jgi:hypothetical protein